ncbi:hypothetical protein BC830DRAFT_57913 [Chytriomyces sp. MP71]|nr:hypothetical protein BC830DRAFT_57913 [Chytriomyces sp. MP71]
MVVDLTLSSDTEEAQKAVKKPLFEDANGVIDLTLSDSDSDTDSSDTKFPVRVTSHQKCAGVIRDIETLLVGKTLGHIGISDSILTSFDSLLRLFSGYPGAPTRNRSSRNRPKPTPQSASNPDSTSSSVNPVSPLLMSDLIQPTSWVDDETINAFMACLQIAYPRVKFFNTFFYTVLTKNLKRGSDGGSQKSEPYNYEGVRRWTKKQRRGIWDFDCVVIPINKGNVHWCLTFACIKTRRIGFLDSMNGSSVFASRVHRALLHYLKDEWNEKVVADQSHVADTKCENTSSDSPIAAAVSNMTDFEFINLVSVCPKQLDGSSCGVFVCYFALWIARAGLSTARKRTEISESEGTGIDNEASALISFHPQISQQYEFVQIDASLFRKEVACVLLYPVIKLMETEASGPNLGYNGSKNSIRP